MADLAVGNFLSLTTQTGTVYRYQNFFIKESIAYDSNDYIFLPFGFSGITVNRTGDGTDANIVLPNNAISRGWADDALKSSWTGHVRTMILDPDDNTSFSQLGQFYGRVSGGGWTAEAVTLTLNSVLDAVGSDIPQRKLSQQLVGDLPSTSGVRLQ